MKKLLTFVLLFVFVSAEAAVTIKSGSTVITINDNGFYSSIKVGEMEILDVAGHYPLLTACVDGKLLFPTKAVRNGHLLRLTMDDGSVVTLKTNESKVCATMEVVSVPATWDAALFGPLKLSIHEIVGDVIGVVQGKGVAFGIQSLNIKTNAGIPLEYGEKVMKHFGYSGSQAELSTGTIPDYRLAATDLKDGVMMQFSCRRRNQTEYRSVHQVDSSLVLPVEGLDAVISGAKIAFFGCSAEKALENIGQIEIEQKLPHPMFGNEWGKTSHSAMASYLITEFNEDDEDFVLDKATRAGFKYIYHSEPFETWGHFQWSKKFVKDGTDEAVKRVVDRAKSRGIQVGIHTLSNFMTTNDAYVTPVPSDHLLKQTILKLTSAIDESQTELTIGRSTCFSQPLTLNAMQIGKELITYGKMEEKGDVFILHDCKRGAFGTTASKHDASEPLYKLWDYPYRTLFPDLKLQDSFADRLVEIFNKTGLSQTSFDGLEGCMYTGQDDYATARFVMRCYNGWNHNVLNDASNLNHFTWHIHTRMNWGEPWGEAMRTGQVENRIKNQAFFHRNLFPRMLGWFLIRLADKNFECSTLEDLEWAMSESAGFDAGYAMTIGVRTMRRHGQIDRLLDAINNWDSLRAAQVFSEEMKAKLRDPATEWHLEKNSGKSFTLYPMMISKPYRCNLGEMQPGQPGGSDWSWNSPYKGAFAFRLKVEGDGGIKNPSFTTQNGVIRFNCEVKEGQYLLFDKDGKAVVTDKNYNTIQTVESEGKALLPVGQSAVSFSCEIAKADDAPEVTVRYITYGEGQTVELK